MERVFARRKVLGAAAAVGAAALLGPAAGDAHTASPKHWPTRILLPDGFQPEGITIGRSPYAWFGSIADGAVYRASLATGRGRVAVPGLGAGRSVIGLKIDRQERRLFLSGGFSREIRVADLRSGKIDALFTVGAEGSMVNDVVLTPEAAWFTDSRRPQLYRLELDRHGEPAREVATVVLGGEWEQGSDFTANGIARTPDGEALLVVNTVLEGGSLMRVDPRDGTARRVDLGALSIPFGDGLLLLGRHLYIVQQRSNHVDVVRLNAAATRGTPIARVTDPRFRIPTTAAAWGGRIYLPNARFGVPPTPDTEYDAVAVDWV